ncbi:hypothetical protein AB0B78_14170 [Streptomyces sp. NPDC040724]|uniref:hypothetical protein n=1 Tax=unclassified Streptomyces TaxID=2593676 RepID=UPI0033F7FDAB
MIENSERLMLVRAGFERVHVELHWYDGPRKGIADVQGTPHYFEAIHDYWHPDDPHDDEYLVWPIDEALLSLEREQSAVAADWYKRVAEGAATTGLPVDIADGGVDKRYDELQALLGPRRKAPADARRLVAEWKTPAEDQYDVEGPTYMVGWRRER